MNVQGEVRGRSPPSMRPPGAGAACSDKGAAVGAITVGIGYIVDGPGLGTPLVRGSVRRALHENQGQRSTDRTDGRGEWERRWNCPRRDRRGGARGPL